MNHRLQRALAVTAVAVALAPVAACSSDEEAAPTPSTETTGTWPRTIEHAAGSTEIPAQPVRVVATSLSLAGTLLAINAPVVAIAASTTGPLTDDKGFFAQWASVADERGVEVLYPNLELDIEAVELAEPDLIVGSTIGADATVEAYDQLSEIAPTILLDYGTNSWLDLATLLGEATGHEADAATMVSDYHAYVAEKAATLVLPEQPVSLVSYQGANGVNVFSAGSAQASVLAALGFDYNQGPTGLAATVRSDVLNFTPENSAAALADTQTLFYIPITSGMGEALNADPLLANQPAVAAGRVIAVPVTTFRMDYYSAVALVDFLVDEFGA